jgi:hypothetical protein
MTNSENTLWEKRGLPFMLTIGVFLLVTIPVGMMRPLWYDELAARWISESVSLSQFVERIRAGVEATPPLYLLIQYVSVHLFGMAEWTGRLPSAIGYAISLTFLYHFVARRLGAIGGAAAMAIMILSGTIYYAQEGRAYGLVFGCAAVAMWAWQQYNERESPRYAVLCGAALFLAGSLHYYSVLLSVPFAVAELWRLWQRRRLDWKMVLVTAMPPLALLVHLPLIRMMLGSLSNPAYAWSKPTFAFPYKFWVRAWEPGTLVLVGAVILLAYLWRFRTEEPAETIPPVPDAELALLIGFVLIPAAGVLFAKLVTNAIAPRYVFSAMLGFSALGAHVLMRAVRAGRIWILLLLLAGGAGNGLLDIRWMMREAKPGYFDIPAVAAETALPVVVDDYLRYAQLSKYAAPEVLSRLNYLTDPERLTRYTNAGQMELITVKGIQKGQFRGQSGYLAPYLETHPRFLLFEPLVADANESWLAHDLLDRGVGLRLIAIQSGGRWYLVKRK